MLTSDIIESMNETMASDDVQKAGTPKTLCIPAKHYEKLLEWVMEHMNDQGFDRSTRYYAKIYIDRFLMTQQQMAVEHLQLLAIAAIRLAVKFNESREYPVLVAIANTGHQYSVNQLVQAEFNLLMRLNFHLKFTTPYCYLKVVRDLLPLSEDHPIFNNLSLILEYCSMCPQFIGLSAGEMIFAALLYLLRCNNCPEYHATILPLTSRWPNVPGLVLRIQALMAQDLDQSSSVSQTMDLEA